jgi:2-methylcitrate dehydratase PrpD
MSSTNPTRQLAEYVTQARPADLPPVVRQQTKVILLDALGSAYAGRDADETPRVIEAAAAVYGPGDATLLNGATGSAAAAAMVNAYLITAVTVCDIHFPTVCHVTPEVVPPALAVAEQNGASGNDLLTAVALGLEVTTRVGVGLNYPAFRARGFHSPGVTGPFGGATSAGRLLGLDAEAMTHAYGIAVSQAAGTWAQLGSPTIKFQQAHGALSGLLAATLASKSLTATTDAFTATDGGLFSSYSDGGDAEALLRDLGTHWELRNITLRPSPAAAYLQGVVTVVQAVVGKHDIRPEDVESMTVGLSGTGYDLHGRMDPKDRFQARLSARYVGAVVLHDRQCWMEQFSPERFADPALTAFARDRVTAVLDPAIVEGGASLEIRLANGETIRETAVVPKGDPSDPLSFDEVADKFRMGSQGKLPDGTVESTVSAVAGLEDVADVRSLLEPLRS